MDAWEQLTSKSTIPLGDAWEHLLAQGGGFTEGITYIESIEVELALAEMDIEILDTTIDVEVPDDSIQVEVDNPELEVELNGNI